ncbi:hypothetical protein BJY04DRAFT_122462 [Aspergillus karnatakaensis]|uniref:uncharacterized protein n=1 Tax=Aspergillus karnatakaensis TaxID=1810916 RepID=UPI003CCDC141
MSGSFDKQDLRQAGTAAKRVHDHKAKWVYGGRTARAGHTLYDSTLPITRPAKPQTKSWSRRDRTRDAHHNVTLAKIDFRSDVAEALDINTSDSSADDHSDPVVAANIPEVFQGQDDPVGLYGAAGEMLFKDAVDKAVEKFEVKETEKLVKEYEFITRESEISIGYLADEDDFELVDHVSL